MMDETTKIKKATRGFHVAMKAMSEAGSLKALALGAEPFASPQEWAHGVHPLMRALAMRMNKLALALAMMASPDELRNGDDNGWTPLTSAATAGNLEVLRIVAGADDPGLTRHPGGVTALMCAAQSGSLPCLEFLLPLSDLGARDCFGCSALEFAAKGRSAPMIDRLVELGLTSDSSRGPTALMIAAERGHMPVIDRLLEVCDPLARDPRDGMSALDIVLPEIEDRHEAVDAIAARSGPDAVRRAIHAASEAHVHLPRCAQVLAQMEAKEIDGSIGKPTSSKRPIGL